MEIDDDAIMPAFADFAMVGGNASIWEYEWKMSVSTAIIFIQLPLGSSAKG